MKKSALVATVALSLGTGALVGALLQGQSARAQAPAYRVLQATVQNAAQLEKFLNEQAAAGWRYNTDIDKKLFIFERR